MYLGKKVRLERIINRENGRTIIVPMDHGVTLGAVEGLVDMRETVNDMAEGGADAVLMHKGLVRCSHRNAGKDVGLIVHLSASTALSPCGNTKTLVGTVEEGIKHGADCVSVHINLGDPNERLMLTDLGRVAEACDNWHMPLLAMVYARGPQVKNGYDPAVVAHCARVGVELGADIVKVPYTGDIESFGDKVPLLLVPAIYLSTVITHLFGGSAGREGAALQIGGSLGCYVGQLFRLDEKDMRIADRKSVV